MLAAIRCAAVLVILLHLAAPLLPEELVWGLWPATYVPPVVRYGLAGLALVLAFAGEWFWARSWALANLVRRVDLTEPVPRLLFALGCGVLFYLLRIRHLRWGDAELLVKALADPYRITYVWQAPLDVFLHARAWQLANILFGWPDPIPVYHILSSLAGVVFVWVLIGVAAMLGRNRTERVLVAGLVLSLGTTQLFFGYIENYSFMLVGVLVYTYLALRSLRGEIPLWQPAAALALTHAFHPSTIILTPSLLYLLLVSGNFERNVQAGHSVLSNIRPRANAAGLLSVVVPYAVVFASVVALMTGGQHGLDALVGVDFPGGGDRSWFVPLRAVTTEWQHYTMFSLGHLVDIVNQQLLAAPLVWPVLALIAVSGWRRVLPVDRTGRFLLLMAAFYLLLTLVWNADYGGRKDWDLFSPAAVPAALLLGWILPRALRDLPTLRRAGWAVLAAQGFHLITWVWQNSRPQ